MRKAAQTGAAIGLSGAIEMNMPEPAKPKPAAHPRYWIWTGLNQNDSDAQIKERYRSLKARGLTGIFLSGTDQREFDAIKEAGLDLHIWMWTTNRRDQWIRDNHPDWYMVSRSGKSCYDQPPYVDYYRWVSPVIAGVRDYIKEKAAEICAHEAVDGLHLDYVRYPDVILPRGLWDTYGLDQSEELADYDFCYSDHTRRAFREVSGRDPLEIADPSHDQEWLHFRYDSVTRLVRELKGVAWGAGCQITAAVFPSPSYARRICRQDWDKWGLDAVCPMLYSSFYNEPVEWIGERMIENIHATDMPIYAGLYMPDLGDPSEFRKALEISMKRGASGISLFGGVSDENWSVFEQVAAG